MRNHDTASTVAAVRGFAALLGSAMVGAVGLALLASQRWPLLDPGSTTMLLLILQWQALGLLICKFGLDQLVFARTASSATDRFSFVGSVAWPVLPVAGAFSFAIAPLFSPTIALLVGISIVFDVVSVVATAACNGRGRHGTAAVGTLLNYPVFFALLAILSHGGAITVTAAILAFCASSVFRLAWLLASPGGAVGIKGEPLEPSFGSLLQPLLNHTMFRVDQLVLAPMLALYPLHFAATLGSQYVYMSKFVELVGGAFVYLGLVLFPRLRNPDLAQIASMARAHWTHVAVIVSAASVLCVCAVAYAWLYLPATIAFDRVLPFVAQCALVLPANAVTFVMYRQARLAALNRNLIISLGVGAAWGLLVSPLSPWHGLAWMVPAQLLAFLVLAMRRSTSR